MVSRVLSGVMGTQEKPKKGEPKISKPDYFGIVSRYVDSGKGSNKIMFAFLRILECPKFLSDSKFFSLSERVVTVLNSGLDKVKSAISISILTKLPVTIDIFRKAVLGYREVPKGSEKEVEALEKMGREGTELVSDGFRLTNFLTAAKVLSLGTRTLAALGIVGSCLSLIIDSLDAGFSVRDIHKAECKKTRTADDKTEQKEKIYLETLNILKKVAGIAATIFSLVGFIMSLSFAGTVISLSIVSIVLTIGAEVYKGRMHETLVKEAKIAAVLA